MKISPQNQMDPKRTKEFKKNLKENKIKPIIEIVEGKIQPLYMFIGIVKFLNTAIGNLLITISHNIKTNNLTIKGRMRYETTGRKTIFEIPKTFKLQDLNIAKQEIKDFYTKMLKEIPETKELKPPEEIEFAPKEKFENIIEKINSSNLFDISSPIKK
jgi:hypothetical protein